MELLHSPFMRHGLPELEAGRKKILIAFQKTLLIRFKSLELLNLALMHRSISNEAGHKFNNERLEFLGDAILGAVTATLLYEKLAEKNEGELAKIKSVVVSEDILAGVARELQLDTLLVLGKGEELSGGRTKKAILADALEALIGALYLDSGYKAAYTFVSRFMDAEINRVLNNRHYQDYKSLLQEFTQRSTRTYPIYRMSKRSGPEHERLFWMEVTVNGKVFGPGTGRNKKSAEQEAAKLACEALISTSPAETTDTIKDQNRSLPESVPD
ncbi:MAG: ribonuclease III [Treponema sp.]|jgi:ribonuclease-3|nr:ribonuclease III [Treponema sp.]